MIIADRLKGLREGNNLSQGDIEKRTGLLRCYVSRVENGHTVPSVETLEKFARALEVPLHHLMYDGDKPPTPLKIAKSNSVGAWESSRSGSTLMRKLIPLLMKMDERGRKLILLIAAKAAAKRRRAGRLKK